MADTLTEILRAASKHPNSRVSKLIHTVEEDPSQKNIVLLLIELAEHAEYSIDFNISLKYYLDMFEQLGINHDLVLNEAGLLLVSSSKIYSKRIDYVQSLVERQILALSNADAEIQQQNMAQQQESQNGESSTPAEKPKRGRKRALEVSSDPYEVELVPKKFKKLTEEKRFAMPKQTSKPKTIQRNIEMEQHIHPAGWLHAAIYDFENEEDVDTKRNYKLFTYHIEHRYNTLVPDINFRLHFKVKDYMDEQEEMDEDEASNEDRIWPPLSEEYVQKYIRLENYILQQDAKSNRRKCNEQEEVSNNNEKECNEVTEFHDTEDALNNTNKQLNTSNANDTLSKSSDTGLGESLFDETNQSLNASQLECVTKPLDRTSNTQSLNGTISGEVDKSLNITGSQQDNDSALGTSVLNQTNTTEMNSTSETSDISLTEEKEVSGSNESTSLLDQSDNTEMNRTTEEPSSSANLNSTTLSQRPEANDSDLSTSVIDTEINTTIAEEGMNLQSSAETNDITSTEISDTVEVTNPTSTTLNLTVESQEKESVLNSVEESKLDDQDAILNSFKNGEEKETLSMENSNEINLEINTEGKSGKDDPTQLKIQLPHNEDEGVFLSDIEEQDCRLLSPVIKTVNILPGVVRKDVTIYMDEELRKALDMRDGIMDHFGTETYKIPIITSAVKQDLIFNILKLPEKLVKRKILFKLGPEMDLFLQARCFKRSKPETVTRSLRKISPLLWFPLNDTDMTGVCMTPPYSPGHCSDFCGFTEKEDDDDTMSSFDFCGFTEEEQAALEFKLAHRLSRDSGVGVDVNNLTPDKEPIEIVFERDELLQALIDNCKKDLGNDKERNETTENLLKQLPADIRDVLTAELNENEDNAIQESSGSNNNEFTINNSDEKKCTDTTAINLQLTSTEASNTERAENATTNDDEISKSNNEAFNALSTENNSDNSEAAKKSCTEITMLNTELRETENNNITTQEAESMKQIEISESLKNSENKTNEDIEENALNLQSETTCDILNSNGDCNKTADVLMPENSFSESDDSQDDNMLDLNTQGVKTKIQQWHEHLRPILAKSRERHHFDVFQLGTEIIDTVQSSDTLAEEVTTFSSLNSQPIASFQDVMENRDQSYVSRYFLSTLLLANQQNIEITIKNKSSEEPSSWQDVHLRLLSTKRHTIAIEDNIGLIEKSKTKQSKGKPIVEADNDEDEPLSKLQNKTKSSKISSSLKRCNSSSVSTPFKIKKTNENCERGLIQSVELIQASSALPVNKTSLSPNVLASTSLQAKLNDTSHANLNVVRTLQPIEKVQKAYDDLDSGIYSIDEISTS